MAGVEPLASPELHDGVVARLLLRGCCCEVVRARAGGSLGLDRQPVDRQPVDRQPATGPSPARQSLAVKLPPLPERSPGPLQPRCEQPSHKRRQPCPVELVAELSDGFRLSRVRVNRAADAAQADTILHGDSDFRDQVTGIRGDDRCPQDSVGAPLQMHFDKALGFAIQNSAIDFRQFLHERRQRDSLLFGLGL